MKFFVPNLDPSKAVADAERLYTFWNRDYGGLAKRFNYSVEYWHEGTRYKAVVGETHKLNSETVYYIIGDPSLFMILTPNRGILNGVVPILTSGGDVIEFEPFE